MIIKNCKKSKTYNIGSGKSTSVQEIVKTICDYYDFKFELENQTDDKKNDTKINFWADISKIRKEIGWKPKTDIKEGIKKMIFYYEKKKNK